jgi:RNA polymerase sigma-70 factor (ECF subfamily)
MYVRMVDQPLAGEHAEIELVVAARSGSAVAFEALIDRYYAPIHAYLTQLMEDADQAEDLTQDTFLAAYRVLFQLRDDRSFAAWLYRIAHNLATSALRRRRLIRLISLDRIVDHIARRGGAAGDELPDLELRDDVEAVLRQLSPAEREALVLHCLAGFTAAEVGGILGISSFAAGRRISRGKADFRARYRPTAPPRPHERTTG